jgi:hypothetical protein
MTIDKQHITISRYGATLAMVVTTLGLVSSIVGVGIYLGNIQTVNAEQTKQIDSLNYKIDNVVTKNDLQNFKDDIKGMIQTYTSQLSQKR